MSITIKKARSPAYPFIPLGKAVERAKEFYVSQRQHPAPLSAAVSLWGYKPKSSGGLQSVAALKQFGLMEDEGSGAQRQVKLTDLALRIIRDQRQPSPERDALVREAALLPKAHSYLRDKWGPNLPADATVLYDLEHERAYTEAAAKDLIKEYRETINFAKLETAEHVSSEGEDGSPSNDEPENDEFEEEALNLPGHKLRRIKLTEGERVVFTEENEPQQYVKLIASGEVDEILLDAISAYVDRQRKRLQRLTEPQRKAPQSGVSFMITRDQREILAGMGYSSEAIKNMAPDEAHQILQLNKKPDL